MSKIQELAFTLNLSAGIPGMNIQSKTADKFDEYAKDLYDYTLNNLEEFLSISDNDGYHVGMAFSHILERTPYIETDNDFTDENTKFKMLLHCAVIGLWRGIQMGTMQSIIATQRLIYLIDKYKIPHFNLMFTLLMGMSLNELCEANPDDVKTKKDMIYKCIKYYLIQLTRAQDAFKDANMKACEIGKKYLSVMHDEYCDDLRRFSSFGIIM